MSKHLAILFVLAATACGDDERVAGNVIGAIIDNTTESSETSWPSAAQQAVEHFNAGLRNVAPTHEPFSLDIRDSQASDAKAYDLAAQLVAETSAIAIMTDTTESADAVIDRLYADGTLLPVQCSACLDDTFDVADPQGFRFRTVDGTLPLAFVMVDNLRLAGGDRNGDGTVKLSIYTGSSDSDTTAFDDVSAIANTSFPTYAADGRLALERIIHRNSDAARVDYVSDITDLLDSVTTNAQGQLVVDGPPDWIIVAAAAEVHVRFTEAYDAAASDVPVRHFQNLRRTSALFELDALADGQQGVSPMTADGESGALFVDDFARDIGYEPAVLAAAFYDNAVTLMLAQLIAEVRGDTSSAALRDALPATSTLGAPQFNASVAGLTAAIAEVFAGSPIDYVGASGPVDYDANRGVRSRVASYIVDRDVFRETAVRDCVAEPCGR